MAEDDELFRRAMAGVKPLAGRSKPRERAAPGPNPRRSATLPAFEIEGPSARAPGVTRRQLAALARGEPPIDARIDLHGHRAGEARAALESTLESTLAAGHRHLLVIHGRGSGSDGEPVLPGVVADVLTRGAHADQVLGFCRAAPGEGGDGASSVLLRRAGASGPIPIFGAALTVGPADIDELGHVSNLVYLRWVLDVAVAHSTAVGFDAAAYAARGEVFVVRRHEIDYLRPAHEGQNVLTTTWVESWKRASCVRRTDITSDDKSLVFARASTLWALVSMASGRPVKIGQDLRGLFGG
jgi:acyl-CoA thioester hydrolase